MKSLCFRLGLLICSSLKTAFINFSTSKWFNYFERFLQLNKCSFKHFLMGMPNHEQMFHFPTYFLKCWNSLHCIKLSSKNILASSWLLAEAILPENVDLRHLRNIWPHSCHGLYTLVHTSMCGLYRPCLLWAVKSLTHISTFTEDLRPVLQAGQVLLLEAWLLVKTLGLYMIQNGSKGLADAEGKDGF